MKRKKQSTQPEETAPRKETEWCPSWGKEETFSGEEVTFIIMACACDSGLKGHRLYSAVSYGIDEEMAVVRFLQEYIKRIMGLENVDRFRARYECDRLVEQLNLDVGSARSMSFAADIAYERLEVLNNFAMGITLSRDYKMA